MDDDRERETEEKDEEVVQGVEMRITICGSMANYGKMVRLKDQLVGYGHVVTIPEPAQCRHINLISKGTYVDSYRLKVRYNYIRNHCGCIIQSDCIVVANYDKGGYQNYIGGNTFLEIGFAHVMGRPIYLIKPIPKIDLYYQEILAMRPKVLNDSLAVFRKK